MDERLQRLQSAIGAGQLAFDEASVGRTCSVLVERKGRNPGQWLGKTPWLQSAHFEGNYHIGDLVEVKLTKALGSSLSAQPI